MEIRKTLVAIDNYDSFTFNLIQLFRLFPLHIRVFRSDETDIETIRSLCPDYILISPGPKDPAHAGVSCQVIESFHQHIPILGVCLGMQCINEVFGGKTVRAPVPVHGKTSPVLHDGAGLFSGIPSPFTVARYHSLMIEPAPGSPLRIDARTADGIIMAVSHPQFPLFGIQFHPESFLTEYGLEMIQNFIAVPLRWTRKNSGRLFSAAWKGTCGAEETPWTFCESIKTDGLAKSRDYVI